MSGGTGLKYEIQCRLYVEASKCEFAVRVFYNGACLLHNFQHGFRQIFGILLPIVSGLFNGLSQQDGSPAGNGI